MNRWKFDLWAKRFLKSSTILFVKKIELTNVLFNFMLISTTIKLPLIADGLYTYKIAMPHGKAYNGKLIKN